MEVYLLSTERHVTGPTPLGELFREYEMSNNPVTKSVLRQILTERLNEVENKSND